MVNRYSRDTGRILFGRDSQLTYLMHEFKQLRQTGPRCVYITAEPGAGKTALVQEFLSRIAAEYPSVEAISSAGQESEQDAEAYRVLLDLLEDMSVNRKPRSNASKKLVLTLLPALASFIPIPLVSAGAQLGLTALTTMLGLKDENAVKNQVTIFQAFTKRVAVAAKKMPLILVLDDAQWADAPSIGAVNYMLTHIGDAPVLTIVAYRSSPELSPETSLFQMKVDCDRRNLGQTLQLPDFDGGETEQLVRHLMPNAFPSRFMRRLFELSGGNPLFIRLFLQLLEDKSYVVFGRDGLWRLSQQVDEGIIPDSIHDVVLQRLAMMPSQSRTVCEIASVEGTRFALAVLIALAESEEKLSQIKVLRILSDVERRFKLISADGAIGDLAFYRFVHGLVRDTLYMSLNQPVRQYYHKQIAELLEHASKKSGNALAYYIASHFQGGNEPYRALPYWIQAARTQRATYAVTEAALSFGSAVECANSILASLREDDPLSPEIERQKATALSGQAEAFGVKAFTIQALQAATEAASLWRILGDQREETLAIHRAALCHHEHQDYVQAVSLFEQGLEIARALSARQLVALLLRDLGNTQTAMSAYSVATDTLTESATLFEESGDLPEWMVTMLCLGGCQYQRGHIQESVQTFTSALKLAESYKDEYRMSQILQRLGLALVASGAVDEGIAAAKRAVALSENLQVEEYRAHRLLGESLFLAERYADAHDAFLIAIADAADVHAHVQLELMRYLGVCVERLSIKDMATAAEWCQSFRDAVDSANLPTKYLVAWETSLQLFRLAPAPAISIEGYFS